MRSSAEITATVFRQMPQDPSNSTVNCRTGSRAEKYRRDAGNKIAPFASFAGMDSTQKLLAHGVDAVCIATPDDRHFEAAVGHQGAR